MYFTSHSFLCLCEKLVVFYLKYVNKQSSVCIETICFWNTAFPSIIPLRLYIFTVFTFHISAVLPIPTKDPLSQARVQESPTHPSPEPSKAHSEEQSEADGALAKKAQEADVQRLLEERLHRLEISHSQASSTPGTSAGRVEEEPTGDTQRETER